MSPPTHTIHLGRIKVKRRRVGKCRFLTQNMPWKEMIGHLHLPFQSMRSFSLGNRKYTFGLLVNTLSVMPNLHVECPTKWEKNCHAKKKLPRQPGDWNPTRVKHLCPCLLPANIHEKHLFVLKTFTDAWQLYFIDMSEEALWNSSF